MSGKVFQGHIIHKAIIWQKMLDTGEAESLSEIAEKEGLTRARVTQIMNLLKLPAEFQKFLVRLEDPKEIRRYSERRLRRHYSGGRFIDLPRRYGIKRKAKSADGNPCRRRTKRWTPKGIVKVVGPMPPQNLRELQDLIRKVALRILREMEEMKLEKWRRNIGKKN